MPFYSDKIKCNFYLTLWTNIKLNTVTWSNTFVEQPFTQTAAASLTFLILLITIKK